MVDKKKNRPNQYTPIDDELSPAHAMVQSANLLDHASLNAIQSQDFDKMVTAAKCWAELGQVIGMVAESAESAEEVDLTTETEVLGFRSEEEREEYEDRAKRRKEKK